jgi:HTH-type transcriptional regulator/antitoxin HigA
MALPDPSNQAIELLKETMEATGLTQEALADLLGRGQPVVSDVLRGKRVISPDLAVELETVFRGKLCAEKLLSLQTKHQIEYARKAAKSSLIQLKAKLREEFPILEMEKRGWIEKGASIEEKVQLALRFARGSTNLDQINPPFESTALARQSATLGYLSPSSKSSRAWQYRVRQLAEITPVKDFHPLHFELEGLPELRKLVRHQKGIAEVPQLLARFGVRLVIVARLDKTKLEGAAMWLDSDKKQPVIALTLRYPWLDHFWFNLAHEVQHIVRKHEFSVDIDGDEDRTEELQAIEDEANAGAAEWLIPQSRFRAFIGRRMGRFSRDSVEAFAEMVNVHPAVVVGMLQHEKKISSSYLNDLKPKVRKYALMSAMSDGFDIQSD